MGSATTRFLLCLNNADTLLYWKCGYDVDTNQMFISKERYNVCQFCHKEFERAEILAIHVEQNHADEIGKED